MVLWLRRRIRRRRRSNADSSVLWQVLYGGVSITVVVLLCVGIWFGTRAESVTIDRIDVSGGETIDHGVIETAAENLLSGSYLLLVPRRFIYMLPTEEIVSAIETIPRVHGVSVERDGTTLKISFGEYVPDALWCTGREETSPCFFIDKTGYAFSIAPPLRGGALVRHIVEESGELEEKQVLDPTTTTRTKEFAQLLNEAFGYRVNQVLHSVVGDVTYVISGGGELKTAESMSNEETIANLASILESEEFNHLEPGNFEYIDLRFGKKVFVKEVSEEAEVDESSETEGVEETSEE